MAKSYFFKSKFMKQIYFRWRKHKQGEGDIENDRWGDSGVAKTNEAFETDQKPV